jgi:hypothetical protein
VNDPADKNIPQVDEIHFSNGNDNQILVNTNDLKGAALYRQLWQESETLLTEMAHRYRSKIIRLTTDREVSTDLFRGLNPSLRRKSS